MLVLIFRLLSFEPLRYFQLTSTDHFLPILTTLEDLLSSLDLYLATVTSVGRVNQSHDSQPTDLRDVSHFCLH